MTTTATIVLRVVAEYNGEFVTYGEATFPAGPDAQDGARHAVDTWWEGGFGVVPASPAAVDLLAEMAA